jgi:hypothetical protein
VNKAFAECYLMEAPDVRAGITLTNYVMGLSGGVIWISASVKGVSIEGDRARVRLELTYSMMGMRGPKGGITSPVDDHWRRIDGQWFHIYSPSRKGLDR